MDSTIISNFSSRNTNHLLKISFLLFSLSLVSFYNLAILLDCLVRELLAEVARGRGVVGQRGEQQGQIVKLLAKESAKTLLDLDGQRDNQTTIRGPRQALRTSPCSSGRVLVAPR